MVVVDFMLKILVQTLPLQTVRFTQNKSAYSGGGFYIHDVGGNLTVSGTTISANKCRTYGGGFYATSIDGIVTITASTITDNKSASYGGGFYLKDILTPADVNSNALVISATTIARNKRRLTWWRFLCNRTSWFGSYFSFNHLVQCHRWDRWGICCRCRFQEQDLLVADSTITNNVASFEGGGFYADAMADVSVTNSTVSNNTAGSCGGGFVGGSFGTTKVSQVEYLR
jgi:predicted outer membrane repeat protein